jgi:hypothetical protein
MLAGNIECGVLEIHKNQGRINCPTVLERSHGLRGFNENNHEPTSREAEDTGRVCGVCTPI